MCHRPSRGEQTGRACVVFYSFYMLCLWWGSREDSGPFKAAKPTGVVVVALDRDLRRRVNVFEGVQSAGVG